MYVSLFKFSNWVKVCNFSVILDYNLITSSPYSLPARKGGSYNVRMFGSISAEIPFKSLRNIWKKKHESNFGNMHPLKIWNKIKSMPSRAH